MAEAARHEFKGKIPNLGDDGDGDNPFGDDPFNDDDGGGGGGGNGGGPSSNLVNTGPSGTPPPTGTDTSGDALSDILSGMLNSQTDSPFGILTGGTQDPFGGAFNYDTGDPSGGISIDITGISTDLTGDPSGGLGTITDPLGNPTTDPTGATGQGQGANNNNFQYQGPISAPNDLVFGPLAQPPIQGPPVPTDEGPSVMPPNLLTGLDANPNPDLSPITLSGYQWTPPQPPPPPPTPLQVQRATNLKDAQNVINGLDSFLAGLSKQINTNNTANNIYNLYALIMNLISGLTGGVYTLGFADNKDSLDVFMKALQGYITSLNIMEQEADATPPTLVLPGYTAIDIRNMINYLNQLYAGLRMLYLSK